MVLCGLEQLRGTKNLHLDGTVGFLRHLFGKLLQVNRRMVCGGKLMAEAHGVFGGRCRPMDSSKPATAETKTDRIFIVFSSGQLATLYRYLRTDHQAAD